MNKQLKIVLGVFLVMASILISESAFAGKKVRQSAVQRGPASIGSASSESQDIAIIEKDFRKTKKIRKTERK